MINEISRILHLPNKAKIWVELFKKTNHPVFIFTAAAAGISYYKILTGMGINVIGFADNNIKEKAGKTININGKLVPIISFKELVYNYNNIAYIIIPPRLNHTATIQQFCDASFEKNKLVNVEFDIFAYPPVHELCETVYQFLADDRSKEIFLEWLKALCTGVVVNLKKGSDSNLMYLDKDIFSFDNKEDVIEGGGGNNADTFLKFIEMAKDFNRYYFCDHDLSNVEQAKKILEHYIKVDYVHKGLYNKSGKINLASYCSGTITNAVINDSPIDVTSIDEIREGKPVSFIKLNVEGSESEALKGAEKSIAKYAPKLALCAHHKPRDFIDLPIMIKNLNPDYSIYLRHYASKAILNFTNNLNLVCYAVAAKGGG